MDGFLRERHHIFKNIYIYNLKMKLFLAKDENLKRERKMNEYSTSSSFTQQQIILEQIYIKNRN